MRTLGQRIEIYCDKLCDEFPRPLAIGSGQTIPLVSSAYDTVASVYESTRDRNALTCFTIGSVESSVKLAGRFASPLVNKLENTLEKPRKLGPVK